ncbi:MAG TPA: hypothetical protein VE642_08920 [Pyrinomonadaceae bacterium]|nr:hypothetical protein [Pyrinomonadaceae bacterium]
MRELASEGRECNVCGARVGGVCENVGARGASFVEAYEIGRLSRAPRERSGLAHAAGFAGVFYLFGHSLAPLALSRWWAASGAWAWLVVALNLLAPLALALAFAAGASLDRSREKAGAMPALFGLVVGLWGTFDLVLALAPSWVKCVRAF